MKTREDKIEEFINKLDIDMEITNYIEVEEVYCFDDLIEQLEYHNAFVYEGEIIYYHNAMKYLMENDPSLQESLEIAKDMNITDLNSEKLASMLKAENLYKRLYELELEIDSFFEELNESVEQ